MQRRWFQFVIGKYSRRESVNVDVFLLQAPEEAIFRFIFSACLTRSRCDHLSQPAESRQVRWLAHRDACTGEHHKPPVSNG